MGLVRRIAPLVFIGVTLMVAPARAQQAAPDTLVRYELAVPASEWQSGCFPPCLCPLQTLSPLAGTFTLVRRGTDPVSLVTSYDVTDVRWSVPAGGRSLAITGSGHYARTTARAATERLTLDLSLDGAAPLRFDSGARPAAAAFPEIQARLSLHGEHCRDTVLVVDARPPGGNAPRSASRPRAGARLHRLPPPHAGHTTLGVEGLPGRSVDVPDRGGTTTAPVARVARARAQPAR